MPMSRKLRRITLEAATEVVRQAEARYVNKKDFVDKGIEPNIRPVVISLVAHGFPTQNSCEGHIEINLYPWIRFEPGTRKRLRTKKKVLRHICQIRDEIEQLNMHLFDFYNQSSLTADRMLEATTDWDSAHRSDKEVAERYLKERAKRFVALPGYFLHCAGAEMLGKLPSELIGSRSKIILHNRQQDMLRFGKFLVSKLK